MEDSKRIGAPGLADDPFRKRLEELAPAPKGQDPSAARTHIRNNFEHITAARKRGVIWRQIADLMDAEGIKAADGSPLSPAETRALYHAERYTRGARRRRRPVQPKVAQAEPVSPAPEPATADHSGSVVSSQVAQKPSEPAPEPPEAPASVAADPDLARVLGGIRELPTVPPPNFRAGWRKKES
ncbi:hypothetical protein GCM10009416_11590 [Craurococcus roseus]|uniref:Uncharacterized protein n=1 Tax=Craurococcus roseus TaxID=77585 RepID=A0ABP3PYS9_9PROT